MTQKQGSLTCVGTGIMLAGHTSAIATSYIQNADIVFSGAAESMTEHWLKGLNPNLVSLQQFYAEGKYRPDTYTDMVDAILAAVRAGKRVCAAFYGHPGIFACIGHRAIASARAEGYRAHMEPGISAEACLYADMGLDPADAGCQNFEASQFMFYRRVVDPSALLILWQVGIAGEHTLTRFEGKREGLEVLVDILEERGFPRGHRAALYEAATLPIERPRIDWLQLQDLPDAKPGMFTTLVIPPAQALVPDQAVRQRLGLGGA
ncbi:MAG: hypothetical protein EP335_15135 [Alphaproteobacteria bacterium]|nr:MAG: hypothetical protein EP335_15135 [Alphaproteobacteria bacterium]